MSNTYLDMKLTETNLHRIIKESVDKLLFEELLKSYLQIAKQYLKILGEEDKKNYEAYLTKGNSYSDKRVTPSIIITNNGHQVGYIRIIQYETLGGIELDCCYLGGGHTRWKMKDPNNPQKDIECACRMAT